MTTTAAAMILLIIGAIALLTLYIVVALKGI